MLLQLLIFIFLITLLLFVYTKYAENIWLRQGIPFYNFEKEMLSGQYGNKKHLVELFNNAYNKYKNIDVPFIGMTMLFAPVLTVIDLEFVKTMLIKDFSYFTDRGMYANLRDDPLMLNLVTIDGCLWKNLRTKLTPTFSSTKLKSLFPTILTVGEQMSNVIHELIQTENVLDIKTITACYTTDALASFTLGIQCNSLLQADNEFRRIIKQFTAEYHLVKDQFQQRFTTLAILLHCTNTSKAITNFFIQIVQDSINYREQNNVCRNDFLQLLINQRNDMDEPFTIKEMAAQVFAFILAGYDTSAATISFCLYELSLNPDIQERARQEIQQVLDENNNELTYNSLKQMEYLEQVFKETLRKHPPVPGIKRVCRKEYHVPNTKYIIAENTQIFIPIEAIQNDEQYFPQPHVFDPSRFSANEHELRHPMCYLPFGIGPRNCIGLRFGYILTLVGIVSLLKDFRFSVAATTPIPLVYDNVTLTREPKYLQLNVEKL